MFVNPKSNLNNKSSFHASAALQFEAWTKEKEAFTQAVAQNDRERQRIEAEIQKLRANDKEISCQHHLIKDELGSLHKENSMLDQDTMRLTAIRKGERDELEQCATVSAELVEKERQSKRDFTQRAGAFNNELFSIYNQQEDKRLKELILVETVTSALLSGTNESSLGVSASEGLQRGDVHLTHAIGELAKAEELLRQAVQEKSKAKDELKRLRAKAENRTASLRGTQDPNYKVALEELESMWAMDCWEGETPDTSHELETARHPSVHAQLFYGVPSGQGESS